MKLHAPVFEDFQPLYIAGDAALSYFHTALGLYLAHLEAFFVKSLHAVTSQIRDAALREDVDRFCRQEAQHYQRHVEFNKVILEQGYPGLAPMVDALHLQFEDFLANRSERFRIAYIAGFEAFNSQFALHSIEAGIYDHYLTVRSFGELFKWHMVEEIEHRNVAYDLYQHLYGGYGYRARMCWLAQSQLLRFCRASMQLMSLADIPRHGERCRISTGQKVHLAARPGSMRLLSMLPLYSPHRQRIPQAIAELSEHYTRLAQSVH